MSVWTGLFATGSRFVASQVTRRNIVAARVVIDDGRYSPRTIYS